MPSICCIVLGDWSDLKGARVTVRQEDGPCLARIAAHLLRDWLAVKGSSNLRLSQRDEGESESPLALPLVSLVKRTSFACGLWQTFPEITNPLSSPAPGDLLHASLLLAADCHGCYEERMDPQQPLALVG